MLTRQWEKNTVATTNPATTQQQHCEYRFQTRLLESLSVGLGLKNFSLRTSWIKDQICLSFLFLKFRTGGFSASLMVGTAPVGMGCDYQAYNVDSIPYNTCGLKNGFQTLKKRNSHKIGSWISSWWLNQAILKKTNASQIGSMFPSRFENKTPLKPPPASCWYVFGQLKRLMQYLLHKSFLTPRIGLILLCSHSHAVSPLITVIFAVLQSVWLWSHLPLHRHTAVRGHKPASLVAPFGVLKSMSADTFWVNKLDTQFLMHQNCVKNTVLPILQSPHSWSKVFIF